MEQEPFDSREQVSDIVGRNTGLANAQRKPENDIHQMQTNLDNMLAACKNSEEKAKKAMVDAGRLADELRAELESRSRDIEQELSRTIQRTDEVHKSVTKGERHAKELLVQQEENKKNQDRITDLVDKLNKEKKSIVESKQKEEEQVQFFEDQYNRLNKLKIRLEKSLDEVEDCSAR